MGRRGGRATRGGFVPGGHDPASSKCRAGGARDGADGRPDSPCPPAEPNPDARLLSCSADRRGGTRLGAGYQPDIPRHGNGRHVQKPDVAQIEVGVTTKGRTLDGAAETHRERAARAHAILQALAADRVVVEKSTYRLTEDQHPYRTPDNPPPQRAEMPFTAQTSLTLRAASIEAVNPAVNRLAGSGLFEIRKVRFSVEADRRALNEARRAAVLDAREQARIYAEAADLTLVEITEITDGDALPPDGFADMPFSLRFVEIIPPASADFTASVTIRRRITSR
ncbi:SIMPL domain-containing protein [Methylobacterium isbiliense]|nr:SIMPL domain-containing protein [Methylobacterium isbiliense]MDN3627803.1 SIMPL domain-containing protein [Methylobacterium isbiliense]